MKLFKGKPTMIDYDNQFSLLNDIEEHLNSTLFKLFLGHALPEELENFRKSLLSKIEYKREQLIKNCRSLAYSEKFKILKNFETQIMDME